MRSPPTLPPPPKKKNLKRALDYKYVPNCPQNRNRICDITTGSQSFFVFRVKVQLLNDFSIFRGIELKLSRGVSSEAFVSYFVLFLPNRMNLIKIMGLYCHFLQILLDHCSIKMLPW